jgi:hypothetical protein
MSNIWQTIPDKAGFETSLKSLVKNALVFNLQQQGHTFTGKLEQSIRVEINYESGDLNIEVYMESYGLIVDSGIKPQNIPFGDRPRGSAETSDFIQGLYRFVAGKLGIGTDEALNVAFMIARAQKREGNPTQGSLKYSKTGSRTEFIQTSLNELKDDIPKIVYGTIKRTFEYVLTQSYSEKLKF